MQNYSLEKLYSLTLIDIVGKITGGDLADIGAIEDSRYNVLGVFDWEVKGLEAVAYTRTSGKDRGK